MFPDTCRYGYFFLFWYVELRPKFCPHLSVTFCICILLMFYLLSFLPSPWALVRKRTIPRPPLWSSGQSSWLQILWSRIRFPALQIFWEVVCVERGPLSLVRIIDELLEWKSSCSGLENRINGCRDPLR
jgi:hypothetical protein